MYTTRVFVFAAIIVSPTGCRTPGPSSPSPVRLLFEHALNLRDTTAFRRAVADSIIFHARDQAIRLSRAQLWSIAQPILTAFPDIRFHVEDEVVSGNGIAARLTFVGTQRSAWEGIAPTAQSARD